MSAPFSAPGDARAARRATCRGALWARSVRSVCATCRGALCARRETRGLHVVRRAGARSVRSLCAHDARAARRATCRVGRSALSYLAQRKRKRKAGARRIKSDLGPRPQTRLFSLLAQRNRKRKAGVRRTSLCGAAFGPESLAFGPRARGGIDISLRNAGRARVG